MATLKIGTRYGNRGLGLAIALAGANPAVTLKEFRPGVVVIEAPRLEIRRALFDKYKPYGWNSLKTMATDLVEHTAKVCILDSSMEVDDE